MEPGSIVSFRERDWVLLPSENPEVFQLRPLTGATDQVVAAHKRLVDIIAYSLPEERIRPSRFPLPSSADVSDAAGAHLLWQAARLTLREGAAPLRSLGRISIRPRAYQFVPLLMALRLDPLRLFIADDVGVGKTIEALLVAREFIDRGEIRRLAVLCPPCLCDQWEKELREKFNLEAVVIRSSTLSQLERRKPAHQSIYEHYPFQVISIDWVKSDRNRHQFLQFCPELVIVDEAHGAAEAAPRNTGQQQRHQLLRAIAGDARRHLILLSATPHSGIETAFRSLLGLLRPEFRQWDTNDLTEHQRIELARHFVQRTRRDILTDWEGQHCFPQRLSRDETYALSPAYHELFRKTYAFCSEIVRTGQHLQERQRRVRYWGALALLRCVMSSPAAAVAALEIRGGTLELPPGETDASRWSLEGDDTPAPDDAPKPAIDEAAATLADTDQRRLRQLARLADALRNDRHDTKLTRCLEVVQSLLHEGFHPILWCRYVATAEYVGEKLRHALGDGVQVTVITGRIGDEERRMMIEAIDPGQPRVLVATDCLSEGVNLQEKFTAVLHYDLPWNPNRLEQREGRVDRYGQTASRVMAVRFYGRDNPVDGAVIDVLLNKARDIHRALGTYVPIPEESETVVQALLNSLFLRGGEADGRQLSLFDQSDELQQFHHRWERDAEREKRNRTRFAQRALKPLEVQRELEAADAVLGDPEAVRSFVLTAAQRLGLAIQPDRRHPDLYRLDLAPQALAPLPDAVRCALPARGPTTARGSSIWRFSFVSPTPEGAEYLGRNHPFVAALARYLLEESLTRGNEAKASRCGVIRTRAVDLLTTLLLLRVRYLVNIPGRTPLLSEEVRVVGYRPRDLADPPWLAEDQALRLLAEARPDANVPLAEKRELIEHALREIGPWPSAGAAPAPAGWVQQAIQKRISERARELEASHKRIRKAVSLRIRELEVVPQQPPDLLGLLVLQPPRPPSDP